MITDEEYRKIISKLKLSTPETYIITQKWNYKIFKEYGEELKEYMDKKISDEVINKVDYFYHHKHNDWFSTLPYIIRAFNNNYNPNVVLIIKENKDA